jgi:hypothetical protein
VARRHMPGTAADIIREIPTGPGSLVDLAV